MPPQQNVCCVLKLTSQERSTFQKHWAAINDSEPQKIMNDGKMYSKIQSVRYTKTKTIHLRRSFFWKKNKLGMALKQEIIVWIKTEFGLSTPLFGRIRKKVQTEWLPVLKPSKIISRISKKSTSYTVNGWETKNSLRFVMPICHPLQT